MKRRDSERGSALLIVFLFVAIIGIMLYRELPVAVFEAQRQKEQLLVDRGHEYVRGIQLFYRRNHTFPASFDQLENTNNVRYLPRRYKDPLTGKDDWRLLHAGPNGMPIDSKVNPLKTPAQGGSTPNGFASSTDQASFGPNANGVSTTPTTNAAEPGAVVAPLPRRRPAVSANGAPAVGATPNSAELSQDPATPLLPGTAAPGTAPDPAQQPSETAQNNANNPAPPTQNQPAPPSATQGLARSLINNTGQQFGQSSQQLMSGGIVGVASVAKGESIKRIDKQTDYSLWEFAYNPMKDTSMGRGLAGSNITGNQPQQAGPQQPGPAAAGPQPVQQQPNNEANDPNVIREHGPPPNFGAEQDQGMPPPHDEDPNNQPQEILPEPSPE